MTRQGFLSSRHSRLVAATAGDALNLRGEKVNSQVRRRLSKAPGWAMDRARPELILLLGVTAVLNLWHLSHSGWANGYYAAAVRSMAMSWHNFLFASFDPSGVMSIDKPPLALWVQALSVRAFGFNSWSILVPEGLMGMGTVALIYDIVRRRFGRGSGFVAGMTLAITPITIAMSRHNNPDSALILCCVAATWFVVRAFEDGRTKWIVWSGVMVGLAFEAKMATALLVVPALAAAWVWTSPGKPLKASRQLLAAGGAMVVVAIAWPLVVALTPAANRPWISGTSDNSIWSLIAGYNGLGRISGQTAGSTGFISSADSAGVFRLLNSALGGQAGWLLGFAAVSGVGLLVLTRLRRRDVTTGWTIAVGGAFLTSAVVFSAAQGIFRPYYVSFMAPFSAALVGAGAAQIAKRDLHGRVLAPLAIAAGAATEVAVLEATHTLEWLEAVVVAAALVTAVLLVTSERTRARWAAVAAVLAVLSIAPVAWKFQTIRQPVSLTGSTGGQSTSSAGSGGSYAPGQKLEILLGYIRAHGGGTLAVISQAGAEIPIIEHGARVAGIGGFSGDESQVSAAWLAQEIRAGRIRWTLGGAGSGGNHALKWTSAACRRADVVAGSVLYDCSGRAAQVLQAAGRTLS